LKKGKEVTVQGEVDGEEGRLGSCTIEEVVLIGIGKADEVSCEEAGDNAAGNATLCREGIGRKGSGSSGFVRIVRGVNS
jgi:hypothetical protein